MPGASQSLSECNTVLNTIVAESLDHIATRLEMADDFAAEVREIFRDILFGHERILFNGDGYSKEWHEEAARRGLPIINDTVNAIGALKNASTRLLYERYGVFTAPELDARYEVLLEQYTEQIVLEGRVGGRYGPPVRLHPHALSTCRGWPAILLPRALRGSTARAWTRIWWISTTPAHCCAAACLNSRRRLTRSAADKAKAAAIARDDILVKTQKLSKACDKLERMLPRSVWPMPTFDDMLYEDIQV